MKRLPHKGERVLFCSTWRDLDIDRDSDVGTVIGVGDLSCTVVFDSDPRKTYLLTHSEIQPAPRPKSPKGQHD